MNAKTLRDNTLRYMGTAITYTVVSILTLGVVYPLVMTLAAQALFPRQANGELLYRDGKPIGSAIIGQLWSKPEYFHGRPSAAGKGDDPTSTGGTNLGPTSKKLIDATQATIAQLRKDNPDARVPIPMDLVTSSASGIDPDISIQAAVYQAPRVAGARNIPLTKVLALIAAHQHGRTFGFLGEPRVNVLELNLALDAFSQYSLH